MSYIENSRFETVYVFGADGKQIPFTLTPGVVNESLILTALRENAKIIYRMRSGENKSDNKQ